MSEKHGADVVSDGDAALQYLNNADVIAMSPEDEKKLLRKIDWRIVPLMCMLSSST